MIPVPNTQFRSETDAEGNVTIFQENKGLFNRIAQIFFKKPRVSQIHLDKMGNFIWPLLDGQNNLLFIAEKVKEHFGEEAEPLYNRLVQYMKTLENYGFVELKSAETDNTV